MTNSKSLLEAQSVAMFFFAESIKQVDELASNLDSPEDYMDQAFKAGGMIEYCYFVSETFDAKSLAPIFEILRDKEAPGVWQYDVVEVLAQWYAVETYKGFPKTSEDLIEKLREMTNDYVISGKAPARFD